MPIKYCPYYQMLQTVVFSYNFKQLKGENINKRVLRLLSKHPVP